MKAVVAFERPDPRYLAGEVLRGTVSIQNPDSTTIRCKWTILGGEMVILIVRPLADIYILLCGTTRVEWKEKAYDGRRRRRYKTVEYTANESYLQESRVVLFGDLGGQMKEFPAGMHHYNFSCLLPDLLPSTMPQMPNGWIEYKVKVLVDKDTSQETLTLIEVPFHVTTVLDLNRESSLLMAVQCEEVKSFCFCSFKPQKAIIAITIPQGGYVPHETISVHLTLDNQSKAKFLYTVFTLQQVVCFRAINPKIKLRKQKAIVVEDTVRFAEATEHKQSTMTGRITVPICAPTCLISSCISTTYLIKVMVRIAGYRRRVTMRIPIKIGTVAIHANAPINDNIPAPAMPLNAPSCPAPGEVEESK